MDKGTKEQGTKLKKRVALEADFDVLSAKMQLEGGWKLVQNKRSKNNRTQDKESHLSWNEEMEQEESETQEQQIEEIDMEWAQRNVEIQQTDQSKIEMSRNNGNEMEIKRTQQDNHLLGQVQGDKDKRDHNSNKKESYVVKQGKLINNDETTDIREENTKKRFEEEWFGNFQITVRLTKDKTQAKKGSNLIKITQILKKYRIRLINIKMINYVTAEVSFLKYSDANYCLDILEKNKDTSGIIARMDPRTQTCKGVINEWTDPILELWEVITNKEEITKIERMMRRKWDEEKKVFVNEATDNIVITFKSSQLKSSLSLWDGIVRIKVRPYVAPVKQCFKCYRYGHIKAACKSTERCVICGEEAHGRCDKKVRCRNCDGEHRSTYKKCHVYEENKNINVVIAYNNCSYYKARDIIRGKEENTNTTYDRYSDPRNWPNITYAKKVRETRRHIELKEKEKEQSNSEKQQRNSGSKQDRISETSRIEKRDINRNNKYYQQFNSRQEEINKSKQGILNKDKPVQSRTEQEKKVRFSDQQEQGEQDNTERKKEYDRNLMAEALQDDEFREMVIKALEDVKRAKVAREEEEIGSFISKGRSSRETRSERIASAAQAAKANWWKFRPQDDVY